MASKFDHISGLNENRESSEPILEETEKPRIVIKKNKCKKQDEKVFIEVGRREQTKEAQ